MPLSIKNHEAEELARELAQLTGTSITQAVIHALRETLLRARGRRKGPSIERAIHEISDRCAALPDLDRRSPEEIIGYDDAGSFR